MPPQRFSLEKVAKGRSTPGDALRHDRLWGNDDLVEIARLAGWPLSWIECGHLGVATEQRHAETFVRGVLGALSGNPGSYLDS